MLLDRLLAVLPRRRETERIINLSTEATGSSFFGNRARRFAMEAPLHYQTASRPQAYGPELPGSAWVVDSVGGDLANPLASTDVFTNLDRHVPAHGYSVVREFA